jgi:hypothetical protein
MNLLEKKYFVFIYFLIFTWLKVVIYNFLFLKNKKNLIPHGFIEYEEINGRTYLTRDYFLNTKKSNYNYPYIKFNNLQHLFRKNEFITIKIILLYNYVFRFFFKEFFKNLNEFNKYISITEKVIHKKNISFSKRDVENFKHSRSISELFFFQNRYNNKVFHHTSPITSGIFKWSLFIENPFTFFHPFLIQSRMNQAETNGVLDLKSKYFYHFIKYYLEHPNCKKIIVNYDFTRRAIKNIFQSKIISNKTEKFTQGTKEVIKYNVTNHIKYKSKNIKNKIIFLFVNSYNGQDINFFCRGGEYAIKVFIELQKKHNNIQLIIRSPIPNRFKDLINQNKNISVIENWIPKSEYVELYKNAHFVFSSGIGGYTETNLHCLMNGCILIGPDDYINLEKFSKNFVIIKSIRKIIEKKDKNFKLFLYQDNEKLFNYNQIIHKEIINKINLFIKNDKYLNFALLNFKRYQKNFRFKNMVKELDEKILK